MPKINIEINSDVLTISQLNDLVKNFALANGWQEKTIAKELDENGDVVLGEDGLEQMAVDENGDPVLEDNPVTPIEFASIPISKYFKDVITKRAKEQIVINAAKTAEDQANATFDQMSLSVTVQDV